MKPSMAFLAFAIASPLTGCASLTGASAPSCDGSARRPLNRSLWDWENRGPIAAEPRETTAASPAPAGREPIIRKGDAGRTSPTRMAGRPVFDIATSVRSCAGADHG
jgi:type IV secretion system protein VirB7